MSILIQMFLISIQQHASSCTANEVKHADSFGDWAGNDHI